MGSIGLLITVLAVLGGLFFLAHVLRERKRKAQVKKPAHTLKPPAKGPTPSKNVPTQPQPDIKILNVSQHAFQGQPSNRGRNIGKSPSNGFGYFSVKETPLKFCQVCGLENPGPQHSHK